MKDDFPSATAADLQPEFREAATEAPRLIAEHFGPRLQAAYLSGSVAAGEAWAGASDFDCFVFTSDNVVPADAEWRAQAEASLAKAFPVVSVFHLNVHPSDRLAAEPFWRFILRYNGMRLRGDDVLARLAGRGHPTPAPSPVLARGRLPFVTKCVDAACRGDCPPSLDRRLDDPPLWTRKLVRNFIIVEGAFLLMAAGRFRSFRQHEVLAGLQEAFPQWTDLSVSSRAVLKDPYAAAVGPEDFMRRAEPFLRWMIARIESVVMDEQLTAANQATDRGAPLQYQDADAAMRTRLVAKLNVPGRHRLTERTIHLGDDGFTIVALDGAEPVGVVSVCWKVLPAPSAETKEACIDLVDVDPDHRRRGIGRRLIELAAARAAAARAYQLRAWTTDTPERAAAMAMWKAMGFAICPTEILVGAKGERVRGCYVVRRLSGM